MRYETFIRWKAPFETSNDVLGARNIILSVPSKLFELIRIYKKKEIPRDKMNKENMTKWQKTNKKKKRTMSKLKKESFLVKYKTTFYNDLKKNAQNLLQNLSPLVIISNRISMHFYPIFLKCLTRCVSRPKRVSSEYTSF